MKKIYIVVMLVIMGMLGGCASSSRMTIANVDNAHKLAKNDSGIVYGAWMSPDKLHASGVTVKSACDDIKNNDSRCANQDDYIMGFVVSDIGFSAGLADVFTLMPKSMDVKFSQPGYTETYVYVKVRAEAGKFGTVLEVASVPGDGKCHWGGVALIGGTVCPAYNWDSSKELRSYDTTLQVMTVSDK